MIGKIVSHFKIKDRIGRGGMGVVYLAEDTQLGRDVALKFLPPHLSSDEGAKKRFIQEAQAEAEAAAALAAPMDEGEIIDADLVETPESRD